MPDDALLIATLALPFLGSLVTAFFPANARNAEAWVSGAVALAELVILAPFYATTADGGVVRATVEWVPEFGLDLVVRLDGFAWMFAMLVTGIGLLVVLYARYYLSATDPAPRFFSFLLAFMGSMLGVVLAGNLIQLAFFWELTSLFSFLLIGYRHHNADARDGAFTALIVTVTGGFCLFAGILLLGHVVGSYDLDRVLASGGRIRANALYLPALVLILLGALTKSAQFPFHFWLPRAMAAPTPVSAYLHSATMVKAGVFLLARLWPALGGTEYWFWILATIGLATLLLGAGLALFQQDLKGLLAYSTISNLGLITLLLGLDSPLAIVAAVFHMMNHAIFKASLFMGAGVIDHETGTRDIRRLSGLARFMPITASLSMIAAAAMAGVPLLNGFLSKEMFFAETIESHVPSVFDDALPYLATLAGMFTVAYSLRFIRDVFFGPAPTGLPRTPHEPPRWMRLPIELLALTSLVVGIIPGRTVGPFLATSAHAILGPAAPRYSLAIWHGFTLALLMSAIALAGGVTLYMLLHKRLSGAPTADRAPRLRRLQGKRAVVTLGPALPGRWAEHLETLLGTRRLQPQLRLLVGVAVVAALGPLCARGLPLAPLSSALDPGFALLWLAGAGCAIGAAYQAKYHRLAALILMGGAGLVACVTFAWLSAPDLALTQLLVETVTTVLLLLGLRWLPKRLAEIEPAGGTMAARLRRSRDLVIALASGAILSILAYAVMTQPPAASISRYFLERAHSEGGGANVVNVILVDFRGFDTLGEITVLAIAALAIYALLRRFRPAPDSIDPPAQQRVQGIGDAAHPDGRKGESFAGSPAVPALMMRLLFPVIGTVALFLLLRGHDLPGGGFVAGLTMAVAIILQYMAGGARWVEKRLRIHPVQWIGVGLLLAAATGAGAWLVGYPFLTSHAFHAELPLIGTVPIASVLLFDLGVFLLVLGATVLVLIALAHQSLRSHRAPGASASTATLARGE